jgi:DNA-binding transcriptional LysR family regulator
MQPADRVRAVWDRLPAFRAVAEHEHLGRAAADLHLSPPALSRTIKLLEAELGHPLFHRRGRGIQLNDEGRVLLTQVRDAMRWVDEAIARMDAKDRSGIVRIGALGVAAQVHVPRLVSRLISDHPGLIPKVTTPHPNDVTDSLLQGRLDLVLSSAAASAPELTVIPLADITNSVYCGPGHPLHDADEPSEDELLAFPFVAPPANPHGVTDEGWPADRRRRIACELDRMLSGVEACASGAVLAVLPDLLARRHPARLRALGAVSIPDLPVHAIRRRALGVSDRMDLVVKLLLDVDAGL